MMACDFRSENSGLRSLPIFLPVVCMNVVAGMVLPRVGPNLRFRSNKRLYFGNGIADQPSNLNEAGAFAVLPPDGQGLSGHAPSVCKILG